MRFQVQSVFLHKKERKKERISTPLHIVMEPSSTWFDPFASFWDNQSLLASIRQTTEPSTLSKKTKFQCQKCPKEYGRKSDLNRHYSGTHTGWREHKCHLCGKGFARKDVCKRYENRQFAVTLLLTDLDTYKLAKRERVCSASRPILGSNPI